MTQTRLKTNFYIRPYQTGFKLVKEELIDSDTKLSDIVDNSVCCPEIIPQGICDGARINNSFKLMIRNYGIDFMTNVEILSKLKIVHQMNDSSIVAQTDDHSDSRVPVVRDLSIRDVDPEIKDQVCCLYF